MRFVQFPVFALALVVCPIPALAADPTALYSDNAWIVMGIEVKAIHQSTLGQRVIGTDGPAAAASKLLAAFGNPDDRDAIRELSALHPLLGRITRLTVVTSEGGEPPASDDFRLFLEGDVDDAALARGIAVVAKQRKLPYRSEAVAGRAVHIVGQEGRTYRAFRLDKNTVAVVYTAAAVIDVLDRMSEKKKSKAPKAVVEAVRAIDPASTPIWLVVGENRSAHGVDYARMVATVALGADATLSIRMEAPDAAAAVRCRTSLELYRKIFIVSKDNRLWNGLGISAKIQTTGTAVTATAVVTGKTLAEEYAKQK